MERVLEVEGPDGQIKEIKIGSVDADTPEVKLPDVKDIDFDLKPTVQVPVIKGETQVEIQKPDAQIEIDKPDVHIVKPEVDLERRSRSRSSSSSSSSSDEEDEKKKDKDKKKKKKDKKEKKDKDKKEKKGGFFGLFGRKSRSPSPKKETKDKDKKKDKKRGSKESTPDRRSTSREGSVEVKATLPEGEVKFPEERKHTGFEVTLPHLKLPSLHTAVNPEGDAELEDVSSESPKGTLEREAKVKAKAPDPNLVIVTGEIVTEEGKPKDSTLERKKKRGFFSLGRGEKKDKDKKRKSSIDSEKSDKSDRSRPSLNVELEGDLPEEGRIDADVKLKADRKRKSSTGSEASDPEKEKKHRAGFGIHFPKFGGKDKGEGETEGPKEGFVVEDLESVEVKAPKVKTEKKRKSSVSSDTSDTEKEKKRRGFDIHLPKAPKVSLPKFGGKGEREVDIDVDEPEIKVEVEKRKSSVSSDTSDTDKEKKRKGFDIHLPKVNLPKFGGKAKVEGDIEGPKEGFVVEDLETVEVAAPKVKAEKQRKTSTSSETSDTDKEGKRKGFDLHLPKAPKLELPKFEGKGSVDGEVDVDADTPKEGFIVEDLESVEVKAPKVKEEKQRTTSTSSETSDTDKEGKRRGFDIHLPKASLPKFGSKGKVEGEVDEPVVEVEKKRKSSVSSDTSDTDKEKRRGFDIHLPKVHLPKFGGKGKVEGDVEGPKEGYVVEDLEAVEVKAPKVKAERKSSVSSDTSDTDREKRKGFDLHLPKAPKVNLPKFGGKGKVEGDVDVGVDTPEVKIEIEKKRKSSFSSDTSDTDKEKKHKGFDIHLPKVSLPRFGGKTKVDGEVDGPSEGYVVEDLESVEVKKPKVKRKTSTGSDPDKFEVELEAPSVTVEKKSASLDRKTPKKKLFGGFTFGKKTPEVKRKSSVSSASDDEGKAPKGPKEGFVIEDVVAVEGSSGKKHKKKKPELDVEVEGPSLTVESKSSSLDKKSPRTKKKLLGGFSLGRKKKGSEASTPESKRKGSTSSQTSEDDKDKKSRGFGIRLPKFGGKAKVEGEVEGPKEGFVVEDLEAVEVKAPKVDKQRKTSTSSETSDTDKEKKHRGFDIHLPKVSLPKFGGKGKVEGNVNGELDVDIDKPEVEVEKKRKSSVSSDTSDTDREKRRGFDLHLPKAPKINLPKFEGKVEGDVEVPKEGYVIEDLEAVEVKAPKVKAERKSSVSSDTSDTDKEKKHRGFDIHLPKVSLPKFEGKGKVDGDVDVDVDAPEVEVEVEKKRKSSVSSDTSDTDKEKKRRGFDIHLPKVSLPKFGGKGGIEGEVDGPKEGYVVEDLEAVEVKAPKVKAERKSSVSSDTSDTDRQKRRGFDLHLPKAPKVNLPKFGGKGKDVDVDAPEVEVEIEKKRKLSISSDTSDTDKEKKHEGFDIHLPKVSLPKFGGKASVDGEVDDPSEGFIVEDLESVEIKKPKLKRKSSTSSDDKGKVEVELEGPSVSIDGSLDRKSPKKKLFGGFSLGRKKKGSEASTPETKRKTSTSSQTSEDDKEKKHKVGLGIHLPKFGGKGEVEGPKEGFIIEDLEAVEVKKPKVKRQSSTRSGDKGKVEVALEGPSVSVDGSLDRKSPKKKLFGGFSLGRKKKGSEASTPESKRKGSTSSQTSEDDKDKKSRGFGIQLPKFGGKAKVEREVEGPKEGFVVEDLEAVEVKAPKVKVEKQRKTSTSSETSDTDKEGKRRGFDIHLPKVSLPKFGGKGSIDGDVDVGLDKPEVEVEVEKTRKSSVSSDTSDTEKKGRGFDIHLPKIHLPKFGGKASVDGEVDGPKEGYVVEDLESVEVKAPKVKAERKSSVSSDTSDTDREKRRGFDLHLPKAPKVSLPKFGGKGSADGEVDVDVYKPEVEVEKKRKSSVSSDTSDTDREKRRGFELHLPKAPKVNLPKFGGKGSVDDELDVDADKPKEGFVVEDLESVEVKAPKVKVEKQRKSSVSSDTSDTDKEKKHRGFDIHLPKVSLPKFGGKGSVDGEVGVDKPEVEVEVEKKRKSSVSSETSDTDKERKHRGFDIHLPKVHLPKFGGKGSVEGDLEGPKEGYVVEDLESVEVKKPKVKRKSSTSSDDKGKVEVELEGPSASVDGSLDRKSPKKKLFGGFSLGRKKKGSEASTPESKRKGSTSSETSDTDKEKKHKAGINIHLPKLKADAEGPKEGYVVEDLETVESTREKAKDKSPKKKFGIGFGFKGRGKSDSESQTDTDTGTEVEGGAVEYKADADLQLKKPEGEVEVGTIDKPKEQRADDVIQVGAEDFMVQDFVVVEEKDRKKGKSDKHIDVHIGKKKKKKGTSSESESTEPSSPEEVKIKGPELQVSTSVEDERDRKSKSLGRRFKELFGSSQVKALVFGENGLF